MGSKAAEMQIELGKVFVTGNLYADKSQSDFKDRIKKDIYVWKKHVAPVVFIDSKEGPQPMVLDPAMSSEPMSLDEFKKKLIFLTITNTS